MCFASRYVRANHDCKRFCILLMWQVSFTISCSIFLQKWQLEYYCCWYKILHLCFNMFGLFLGTWFSTCLPTFVESAWCIILELSQKTTLKDYKEPFHLLKLHARHCSLSISLKILHYGVNLSEAPGCTRSPHLLSLNNEWRKLGRYSWCSRGMWPISIESQKENLKNYWQIIILLEYFWACADKSQSDFKIIELETNTYNNLFYHCASP